LSSAAALAMENAMRLGGVPLRDLVEVRVVVEGAAVEAAAGASAVALEDARDALAAMKTSVLDIDSFRAADLRFHRSLAAASGNAAFPLVMGVLRTAIASHLGEALLKERDVAATMRTLAREHEAIFNAVARGHGARARTLVTTHIRTFYEKRRSR